MLVKIVLLITIVPLFAQEINDGLSDSVIYSGKYLGQKPPGKVPGLFAQGMISDDVHDSPNIFLNEEEMVILTMGEGLKYYKLIDEKWVEQERLPFNQPEICNEIFLSPSGKRVYFLAYENGDENFYYTEITVEGWSEMKSLGDDVNSFVTHWQFSTTKNEDLYLSSGNYIMVSRFDGKKYLKPVYLKMENNESIKGYTPYIAPDESYMIYSIRTNASDKFSDLYISYKLSKDKWSNPIDLGSKINCRDKLDLCPIVSPNGRYLFFISRRLGSHFQVFWVDAEFIEDLKPKDL